MLEIVDEQANGGGSHLNRVGITQRPTMPSGEVMPQPAVLPFDASHRGLTD
jgi:hypothetical protein